MCVLSSFCGCFEFGLSEIEFCASVFSCEVLSMRLLGACCSGLIFQVVIAMPERGFQWQIEF